MLRESLNSKDTFNRINSQKGEKVQLNSQHLFGCSFYKFVIKIHTMLLKMRGLKELP